MKNKKTIIISIITILLLLITITTTIFLLKEEDKIIPTTEELETAKLNAFDNVSISKIDRYVTKESTKQDESVYLIKDKAILTLRNSSISKTGDTTNVENSKKVGLNSAIVSSYNSQAKIYSSNISTEAEGANALYSSGQKSYIVIEDSTIETLNLSSSALSSISNGKIEGTNLIINTKSKYSPALQTLSNNSSISIKDSAIETNGAGSPIIYANGKISLTNTTGTANGSRIAILKNGANVNLNQVTSIVSGGSGEENYKESGILIYSTSNKDKATFTAIDSSLNINQNLPYYNIAPLFIIDNISTTINLTNTPLNFGSNKLMQITNSNVTLNITKEELNGEITIDDSSNLTISLKDNSKINCSLPNNTTLSLDKTSTLILNKDTYLKSLENEDLTNKNIQLNNYKLYVNGKEIKNN